MKRLLVMIAMFAAVNAGAQQVIYDENAEVRNVDNFSSIEVSGTVSVYVSQSKSTGLAVSAGDEKYNEKIKTSVQNGVLKISVDGGVWNGFSWSNRKLKAYVSVQELSRLQVSGASYVLINDNLMQPSLNISIYGASEVKGNIQVKSLNADMSGASVLRISGSADNTVITASGACKINGFDLKSENVKVEASGASNITITANKELSANASGGSTIQYRGEAVTKTLNSSGGASIKKRGGTD